MSAPDAVLTARNVSIEYEVDPPVKAVRNVSLTLNRGEILGPVSYTHLTLPTKA